MMDDASFSDFRLYFICHGLTFYSKQVIQMLLIISTPSIRYLTIFNEDYCYDDIAVISLCHLKCKSSDVLHC